MVLTVAVRLSFLLSLIFSLIGFNGILHNELPMQGIGFILLGIIAAIYGATIYLGKRIREAAEYIEIVLEDPEDQIIA